MNKENENVVTVVGKYLDSVGIPSKLSGYGYICTAVALLIEKDETVRGITKILYPLIADEHGTTAGAVERNMRTAIGAACKKSNDVLRDMASEKDRVHFTNSEFIFKTVNIVKRSMAFVGYDKY